MSKWPGQIYTIDKTGFSPTNDTVKQVIRVLLLPSVQMKHTLSLLLSSKAILYGPNGQRTI
ncbi:uncharacterized protein FOMMEDRAFT_22335 [Fomitiporia mediterranea MF3/22]|uniref:uncharacterized protein n=1 Tax=Fomitiporia mediterranea (strain MF3/22) TaxID=694068 RepID=UPI0004407828|nr:uncharacterized protein FOMMEDRAFT_22335 [Fomitiporia mediterranea MF3/22]EJD00569.1 hypothetical protein FOMMEDRAFT_22335 [Fomitiporia mediterranea MF3/22]